MAVGEKKWSSKGKSAKRMVFQVIPAGEYQLKIQGGTAEIAKGKDPTSMPYVKVRLTALGTAAKEGAKDSIVFHQLYTSLKPGTDGVPMPERGGQIVELARALGEEADFRVVAVSDGQGNKQDCLDAMAVKAWVQAHDGMTITAKVKVRKGTKEYPNDQNQVDYFVEAVGGSSGPDEDEEDDEEVEDDAAEDIEADGEEDDEDDEAEDDDSDDESEDDDDEEEPTPAPAPVKKAKKPAPAPEPAKKAKKK